MSRVKAKLFYFIILYILLLYIIFSTNATKRSTQYVKATGYKVKLICCITHNPFDVDAKFELGNLSLNTETN